MCSGHDSNNGYNSHNSYDSAKGDMKGLFMLIVFLGASIGFLYAVSFVQEFINKILHFLNYLF